MGGVGSGRRNTSSLGRVESCRAIDIVHLRRKGCLLTGWEGHYNWLRDGHNIGSAHIRAENDGIRLLYQVRVRGAIGSRSPTRSQLNVCHAATAVIARISSAPESPAPHAAGGS